MTINIQNENGKTVIALDGRLDTTTSPELEKVLNEALPNINDLVFDFGKLEYLSSAGLRILLSTQKVMTSKKGKMVIKHVNETILDVFDMTGFSSILTIEE